MPTGVVSLAEIEQELSAGALADTIASKPILARGKTGATGSHTPNGTVAAEGGDSKAQSGAGTSSKAAKGAKASKTGAVPTEDGVRPEGKGKENEPDGTLRARDTQLQQIPARNVRFENNTCFVNLDKMSFTDADLVFLAPLLGAHLSNSIKSRCAILHHFSLPLSLSLSSLSLFLSLFLFLSFSLSLGACASLCVCASACLHSQHSSVRLSIHVSRVQTCLRTLTCMHVCNFQSVKLAITHRRVGGGEFCM